MKIFITSFLLFFAIIVKSQDTIPANDTSSNSGILKIFLNCDECDFAFMKQELPYLHYVRDRKLAEVQIIVTSQGTGAGGDQFSLQFLGLGKFNDMNDTLTFSLPPNYSNDEFRNKMNQFVLLGLTRFIAKTPYADEWLVNYNGETSNQEIKDKWNFWVFNISANGWFNGEAYYRSKNIYGSFSARRITNEQKLEFYFNNNYNQNNYYIDDSTEIESLFRSYNAQGSYVHSLNDHWSAGTSVQYSSSIFNNLKVNLTPAAMIEYNIFPYSESTRKQFRFYYKAGMRYDQYYDTTILNKTKMLWGFQSAGMYVQFVKEWGSFSTWLGYNSFLNNFKFWSAELWTEATFNIFKGFSLNFSTSLSFIQDQVTLRLDEASDNDILLRQVQLPTSFRYWTSIGISYTFGSIYNNIVNPRLD